MDKTIDFDANYRVKGCWGIAWCLIGYATKPSRDEDEDDEIDESKVIAFMVGDNKRHEIDVEDLVLLPSDKFCPECGQIGCGHGAR